jgi:hypothetical protein
VLPVLQQATFDLLDLAGWVRPARWHGALNTLTVPGGKPKLSAKQRYARGQLSGRQLEPVLFVPEKDVRPYSAF